MSGLLAAELSVSGGELWLIAICILTGLLLSVPLNLIITRYPRVLQSQWEYQQQSPSASVPPPKRLALIQPGPDCHNCGQALSLIEAMPLLGSFGSCRHCGSSRERHRLVLECLYPLLLGLAAWRFGAGWELPAVLWGITLLMILALVDQNSFLLPDTPVWLLLWSGLLFNASSLFVVLNDALWGAVAGYLLLWLSFQLFYLATSKEGLGRGDFKLAAALGAWLGWQALPALVLIASTSAAIWGLMLIASGRLQRSEPMPFGPWLALSGTVLLFGGSALQEQLIRLLELI